VVSVVLVAAIGDELCQGMLDRPHRIRRTACASTMGVARLAQVHPKKILLNQ
jgi:hypothetical protein